PARSSGRSASFFRVTTPCDAADRGASEASYEPTTSMGGRTYFTLMLSAPVGFAVESPCPLATLSARAASALVRRMLVEITRKTATRTPPVRARLQGPVNT